MERAATQLLTTLLTDASAMERNTLEMINISKQYSALPVLRSVDIVLGKSECVALVGANGSGKTTLLRIAAGLASPTTGRVLIQGQQLKSSSRYLLQHTGFLGHNPYIYPDLTVWENLQFFGRMYQIDNLSQSIEEILLDVDLAHKVRVLARELSSGQLQRLAFARAVLHNPDVLLLDEPENALDVRSVENIFALMKAHKEKGKSILFTSHNLQHVLTHADRIAVLSAGYLKITNIGEIESEDHLQTLMFTDGAA